MSDTAIAFPHLGIYLDNVPKSFTVFGFTIALYGVVIAIGMAAGLWLALWVAKKYGHDGELVWDYFLYGIIFGLIGARIYYVVFAWDYYKNDLLSIFNLRKGGLAIYGGVIAAFLTLFLFCRKKKINYLTMVDSCVPGLALGLSIGRWGIFSTGKLSGNIRTACLRCGSPRWLCVPMRSRRRSRHMRRTERSRCIRLFCMNVSGTSW